MNRINEIIMGAISDMTTALAEIETAEHQTDPRDEFRHQKFAAKKLDEAREKIWKAQAELNAEILKDPE